MKKIRLIGLAIVTLALLLVGAAAPALAHPGDSDSDTYTGVYIDGPTLARVAEALGLTPEELSTNLQAGETLAEIAQKQNVPEDTVIDAIIAPYAEQLKLQVRYGYLTQERADTLLETAREHAGSLLEQDLSSTGGNADWWQEMGDYCGNMMGNYDGANGYGGMMGGGMMGNYGGGYGMMGPGMMGGWYGQGYGSGGMMGPGYGGMMGGGMMGNYGGGYGMMGPGMMGGWYGQGYGSGGMIGPGYNNNSNTGWSAPSPNANPRASNGWTSIFSRFWNGITGRGSGSAGGMMGGGFGGGMMGGW